jgi:hypothetical protein
MFIDSDLVLELSSVRSVMWDGDIALLKELAAS